MHLPALPACWEEELTKKEKMVRRRWIVVSIVKDANWFLAKVSLHTSYLIRLPPPSALMFTFHKDRIMKYRCYEDSVLRIHFWQYCMQLHTAQKNEPCTLLKLGSYLMKNYITNCGVEGYALYPQSDCSSLRLLHPTLRKRAVFTLVAHLEQDFLVISWYISDNQTTPLSPICGKPFNNDFIVFLDTIAYPLTYPLIHLSYSFHIPELCNLVWNFMGLW